MLNTKKPISLANEQETLQLGMKLATQLQPGKIIFLQGNLGAGKTTLVRGILQGLGYTGKVKSPTFTLVEAYEFNEFSLYHFDLYRLEHSSELETLGFRDYVAADSLCLIEWAEKATDFLPKADIIITLDITGNTRCANISNAVT